MRGEGFMQIGAQLYTVRDYTKSLEDFATTLAKIAEIGYQFVQVSGSCDYSADWLKQQLDKNGLKCVLTHYDREKILQSPKDTVNFHKQFDCNNIGIGYYDIEKIGVEKFYNQFMPVAKVFSENESQFFYHNHYQEFKRLGNDLIIEQLLNRFTADELQITFDTYWAQKAGADPIWWIHQMKDRVKCVHFKDMDYLSKMAVIGEGNMNFEGIINACSDAGTEYALVEQDDCNGKDPFDCLKRSYLNLRSFGL